MTAARRFLGWPGVVAIVAFLVACVLLRWGWPPRWAWNQGAAATEATFSAAGVALWLGLKEKAERKAKRSHKRALALAYFQLVYQEIAQAALIVDELRLRWKTVFPRHDGAEGGYQAGLALKRLLPLNDERLLLVHLGHIDAFSDAIGVLSFMQAQLSNNSTPSPGFDEAMRRHLNDVLGRLSEALRTISLVGTPNSPRGIR